jgi:hypothetical protein
MHYSLVMPDDDEREINDGRAAEVKAASEPARTPKNLPLQPGDRYQDGSYWVFTSQYHLRRGYCCENGCRHCPYGNSPN